MSDELRKALHLAFEKKKQRDKWTEQKVADLAGVSKTTVHHIISLSTHRPAKGSKDLPKVCEVLEVDLASFLPLDDEQRALLRALSAARAAGKAEEFIEAILAAAKLAAPKAVGPSDPGE